MTEEDKQQMALFRYALIAPLVTQTYPQSSKEKYYRETAEQEYTLPNGKQVVYKPAAIKTWYLRYLKYGLEGLTPRERRDCGDSRKLTKEVTEKIYEYRVEMPYITGKKLYDKLIEDGLILYSEVSIDAIYRYLKGKGALSLPKRQEECLSFEFSHANDCWQADSSHGPTITVTDSTGSKRKLSAWLISFIDDASRLIVHGEFFEHDNGIHVQQCFQKAIAKFGKPRLLYLDNGGSYANRQLALICAELGIRIIHTKPYSPQGHGKCERSHRSMKDGWLHAKNWNEWHSLEDINTSYQEFLAKDYTNKIHSSIGMTPKERYMKDYERITFVSKEVLDCAFLHRITRTVSKTALVSVENTKYEVEQEFIGTKKLELRYDPIHLELLFIYRNGKQVGIATPVKTTDNVKRKRKTVINYEEMDGDEHV